MVFVFLSLFPLLARKGREEGETSRTEKQREGREEMTRKGGEERRGEGRAEGQNREATRGKRREGFALLVPSTFCHCLENLSGFGVVV